MKWVVVTQWVRTWWFKSHLTKASPAGQERTPRASPAMGVRSWSERGGRPRDGAPKCVESWSEGEPQRSRGHSRRFASAGRQQSWVRPRRVRRTPPGSESGAGLQRGSSGTWENHLSPCTISGWGGPGDHRPWRDLGASTRPRARVGQHEHSKAGTGSGSARRVKRPETGRGESSRRIVPVKGGNRDPRDPREGRQRRASRAAGKTDGRYLEITNRHPTTPADGGAGRPRSPRRLYDAGAPD
jgi:hypothetical protein